MKKGLLFTASLAMLLGLGVAAGARLGEGRAQEAKATTTYRGMIGIELQSIGGNYWDKDNGKLAIKVYNTTDAGKMFNGWTEVVQMTEGIHKYVVPYEFNVDPSGSGTKMDIYRAKPEITDAYDALDNNWNSAINLSFGEIAYVYDWNAASTVDYRIHAKSHEWAREWDNMLHDVKIEGSVWTAYNESISLSATDEFKLATSVNGGSSTYDGAFSCHESISTIVTGDQTNNIACSVAGNYSFFKHPDNPLYITSPKYAAADDYAQDFLSATSVCDSTGAVNNITSVIWTAQSDAWTALAGVEGAQALLLAASPKDEEHGGSYMEQCAARYEYIVKKYGSVAYSDFMGRFGGAVVPPNSNTPIIEAPQSSSYIVVVIVAATAAVIGAGLFFLLKRKQD